MSLSKEFDSKQYLVVLLRLIIMLNCLGLNQLAQKVNIPMLTFSCLLFNISLCLIIRINTSELNLTAYKYSIMLAIFFKLLIVFFPLIGIVPSNCCVMAISAIDQALSLPSDLR